MNKFTFTIRFFTPQRWLLLLAFIVLLSGVDAFAQQEKKKKKKKSQPLELRVGFGTTYDNNILKYSDKYLERFDKGEDPGRFHIETYDDVILNPTLDATLIFNVFKKLKSRINAGVSPKFYAVNSIKNWNYMSAGYQQYIAKKAYFKFSYSYIPEFYVRHFRVDEWVEVYGYTPETFKPYIFSKDNFEFYIQNTFFKNTRIRLSLDYAIYYYNEFFTEYDSKDWYYEFSVTQPVHKKVTLDFTYTFVVSDAKGYDASYQTAENTDGPNADFEEDRFELGVTWELPKLTKRNNELSANFQLMNRYFSSSYSPVVDPLHAGRVDNNYRVMIDYSIDLNKSFGLTVFYNWLMRDSHTKSQINSIYVSNEKDYRQDLIGFKLQYRLKF